MSCIFLCIFIISCMYLPFFYILFIYVCTFFLIKEVFKFFAKMSLLISKNICACVPATGIGAC